MMVACDNRSRDTRELSGEVVMFFTLLGIWVIGICSCQNSANAHLRFTHFIVKFYIQRKNCKQIFLMIF